MQESHEKSHFTPFLRKESEQVRTTLPSNFLNSKRALFPSTFTFVAQRLRK
jgi:hypothetical protein